MIDCDGSFEGPCKLYSYIRHLTDDAPIFVISFSAFSVHIPLPKSYENFAAALNDPSFKAKEWSCAPGWCVKLMNDEDV